jgi:hypothetical protein
VQVGADSGSHLITYGPSIKGRRNNDVEILRVFNNNVVLSRDHTGQEVILTGRGLGFQAKPGQRSADLRP